MGLFDRLRHGLARTAQALAGRLDELVGGNDSVGDPSLGTETLDALEELLISADVGVSASRRLVEAVARRQSDGRPLRARLRDELLAVLEAPAAKAAAPHGTPHVVLVVGVNGTGKTTTVGKLAHRYAQDGHRVLVCAADTFRAAAVDQLQVWAERAGVGIVRAREGADPAAVVHDALSAARRDDRTLVLVDTAGRLHTRVNLMAELDKVRRVAGREVPGAPHEVLLVLDASVGQNGVAQAREFAGTAGVTGVVLTKLDGTAKGGVAVAIAHDLGLPIRFVGVGEQVDDLLPFSATEYVEALFQEAW